MKEINFEKYKIRGVNYHWNQISKSIRKRNVFVIARYELILSLIGNNVKGKKILDVGCGYGVLSYLLSRIGAIVTGIDSLKEAIKYAVEKFNHIDNVEFLVASAYKLPFKDKGFDFIVSSEVVEHLVYSEKMLVEIKKVWNQDGKIVIASPIKYTEKPLNRMHFKEFFISVFKQFLEKYFENVKIIKSYLLFWLEFQNKLIFGQSINKILLNCIDILFGFNPFLKTGDWKYYTLQTALISK